MKPFLLSLSLFIFLTKQLSSQTPDSLNIYYYENYPYSYTESGKSKGIEIEIIEEYVRWMKEKKNVNLVVNSKAFKDFSVFYQATKSGYSSVVGLGSVTENAERSKEVQFSPPFMNNVAVLITDGKVATAKTKTANEISKTFAGLSAMVVNNSSHINYLNTIKQYFVPALKITTTESQNGVLASIASDKKIFGYVDIVAYWSYLKKNPDKFLKIQKLFSEPKESLCFILPKSSTQLNYINEFFEAGFGFTSTKRYHQILENYLGFEIIDAVEIQ